MEKGNDGSHHYVKMTFLGRSLKLFMSLSYSKLFMVNKHLTSLFTFLPDLIFFIMSQLVRGNVNDLTWLHIVHVEQIVQEKGP